MEQDETKTDGSSSPTRLPPPPGPPPWWDVAFLKTGGLAVLTTGLLPGWLGEEADLFLVGVGLAALGGRELLGAALSRHLSRSGDGG